MASLTLLQAVFSAQTLIPAGAVWRYKADGSDQGTLWSQPGFNASGWASGVGPLGFGDPHIVTVLPSGFVTYYFRGDFMVNNPSSVSGLLLRLLRDDGAVVYLNGTEVRRDNMPAGAITFSNLATVAVSGAGETNYFESAIPTGALVAGANVLAVEVHQNSISSSDLGFDAALIAESSDVTPPTIVSASATYGGPTLTVVFNNPVEEAAATDPFDYFVNASDGSFIGLEYGPISGDQKTVTLSVDPSPPFVQGVSYTLNACCICDTSGNCMPGTQSIPITFPSQCTPSPQGLVAWWPFDGSPKDVQGHHPTTLIGNPAFVAGKVAQALQFDSVDDAVRIPAAPSLDVGQGNGFSIEGWIQPNELNLQHPIVEWNDDIGGIGAHFWTTVQDFDGQIKSLFANIIDVNGIGHGIVAPPNLLTTAAFQHVALTYDKASGSAALYIGGNPVTQKNLGTFTPQTSTHLYIGYRSSGTAAGNRFSGAMDEVSLYNRALSSAEIAAIAAAGSSGKCKPPPTNDPPTANNQSVTTHQNEPVAITLTGSDPDSDPLTFTVTSSPAHGTLSGTAPNLTYTPAPDFVGSDAFAFTVSDGQFESTNALVRIQVISPPDPPDLVSAIAGCNGLNVVVMFDEPVDPASSQDPFNYTIVDSVGNPVSIGPITPVDPQTVMLTVDTSAPLVPGQAYVLDAFFVCDTGGDCSGEQIVPIQFETVPPQVNCSVAVHTLLPSNNQLVNVGLSASASEGAIQVRVYSDEPKVASLQDAIYANGTLQLRARKSPSSDGRVYLIVVTAADPCGNVGVCCTTVVVPATGSQASINAVNAQAAAAQAHCSPTGAPSTPHQILP